MPSCPEHVNSAFFVPKKDGGLRLIIDLRPLNVYFPLSKVKYETLAFLRYVPMNVVSGLSLDLQDGYHCLRVHPDIRKYMNFYFDGHYYRSWALPFGWSLAPAVFTRLLRPVIAFIRTPQLAPSMPLPEFKALIASIYLDDLLILIRATECPERVIALV